MREHLLEGVPVSELIDKYQIHAVQYYQWQKRLVEEGGCMRIDADVVACSAATVYRVLRQERLRCR